MNNWIIEGQKKKMENELQIMVKMVKMEMIVKNYDSLFNGKYKIHI